MTDYQAIFRDKLPAPGNFPQCFAFSIHKAGSSLMHAMIDQVCANAGIPGISIPDVLFKEGLMDTWSADRELLAFIQPGRVYYGFRSLPRVLIEPEVRLREHKSVLLVRDPRDALVSQYFSFGGKHVSHSVPEKNVEKFVASTQASAALDIDAYAIQFAPQYHAKLQAYLTHLDFNNVLLRRYEDIYFDKQKFLGEIFKHFGIEVPEAIIAKVAAANDVRPATEEVGKHIRKGAPGDHREKLKSETIEKLDDLFREIGKRYGYDL